MDLKLILDIAVAESGIMKPEFILDIVVAVASFVLSLVAIIISIVSLCKQNHSIKVNSSLQLYKIRFKIYDLLGRIQTNIIHINMDIKSFAKSRCLKNILDVFHFSNDRNVIRTRNDAIELCDELYNLRSQFDLLFKKDLADKLSDLSDDYILITFLFRDKTSFGDKAVEKSILSLLDYDFKPILAEISKYINFSDITL